MTGDPRPLMRRTQDKIKNGYDVLMDGYTFFTGIHFFHDAESVAWDMVRKNPKAKVEIRWIKTETQTIECYIGVPMDGRGRLI